MTHTMEIHAQTVLIITLLMSFLLVGIWLLSTFLFKAFPKVSLQFAVTNGFLSLFILFYVIRSDLLTYIITDIVFLLSCFFIRRSIQELSETKKHDAKYLIIILLILIIEVPSKLIQIENKLTVVSVCLFAIYMLYLTFKDAYIYMIKDFKKSFTLCVLFPIYSIGFFTFLRIIQTLFAPSYAIDLRDSSLFNTGFLICMLLSLLGFNAMALGLVIANMVKKIKKLSQEDYLTKIFNRRYLSELAENDLVRLKHSEQSLSVILLDIDHFKKINDTYGHAAGDLALVNCVEVIKESIRKTDYVGRLGGEEFCIVLPDTNIENAKHIAEKIRIHLLQKKFFWEGQEITMTASLGISSLCGKDEISWSSLLHKADNAMYKAKNNGRNQVMIEDNC